MNFDQVFHHKGKSYSNCDRKFYTKDYRKNTLYLKHKHDHFGLWKFKNILNGMITERKIYVKKIKSILWYVSGDPHNKHYILEL